MKLTCACTLLLSFALAAGQKEGSTATITGPKVEVVATTQRQGRVQPVAAPFLVSIRVKITNTSPSETIVVANSTFQLRQPSGKIQRCLTPDQAAVLIQTHGARTMSLITEGLGGPIQGRNNRDSMEAAGKGHVLSTALSFGEVPPNSFIEGLIYFEGTAPALPKNFEAAIVAPDLFPGQVSIKW